MTGCIVVAAVGIAYVVSGVLAYGIELADLQRSFPSIAEKSYREDCGNALFLALFGPIGLLGAYLSSGFAQHGLMYRRPR